MFSMYNETISFYCKTWYSPNVHHMISYTQFYPIVSLVPPVCRQQYIPNKTGEICWLDPPFWVVKPWLNPLIIVDCPIRPGHSPVAEQGLAPREAQNMRGAMRDLSAARWILLMLRCSGWYLGMGQNPIPLVNIKIAGKWMFIPLKMVLYRYWSIATFDFDDLDVLSGWMWDFRKFFRR